jgi:hypothetical protein
MGQVLAWLLSVVEGVAAAPFLAFAHFDTDGEGMGQRTAHGYTFMLQSFGIIKIRHHSSSEACLCYENTSIA